MDAKDYSHLIALQTRLAHERQYLSIAKTANEKAIRNVWIAQIEREIAGEEKFLGLDPVEDISDDDLMAALGV